MSLDRNAARQIADYVYTPTVGACALILVHFVWVGLGGYFFALFVAYKTATFEEFTQWPSIAKVALYSGPVQVLFALYCATQSMPDYWMMIPVSIQALLGIVAYLALRFPDDKPKPE
jgi:hypothetical protein